MPDDLFGNQPEPDYLVELVGEGKKFKDDAALAKGKYLADQMVENQKVEIDRLKSELANKMSLEEFYSKIKTEGIETKVGDIPDNTGSKTPELPDIEKLVLETLDKTNKQNTAKQNQAIVNQKVAEVWGDNTVKELSRIATELGVSTDYLLQTATSSPQTFFRLTGLDRTRQVPAGATAPTSTVSLPETGTKRDAAYYRELRRTNPRLYSSSKVQAQMERDAFNLGLETFFN